MSSEKKYLDLNIKEILENWEVWHAIREMVANSLDEHKMHKINKDIIFNYDNNQKQIEIMDFGSGIKSEHFIQTENKAKLDRDDVIGRFGIGLKDAIATLHRNKAVLKIFSKYGTWAPIERMKTGTNIETIHMEESETIDNNLKGTKIIISNVDVHSFEKTKQQFLCFQNTERMSINDYGEIIERKDENGFIYINGMKVSEDEGFGFSYNILKLNKKINKGLNRERSSMSRDSYRDSIIGILKKSDDNILTKIREYKTDEYSFIDIKKLIFAKFNIYPALQSTLDNNPAFAQYLRDSDREYEIVSEKEYKLLANSPEVTTLQSFGEHYVNEYESEEVDPNSLNKKEFNIFKNSLDFIKKYNLNPNNMGIFLIKEHPNALGIFVGNRIEIVRKSLTSFELFISVLLHELAHSSSNATDGTIDFEKELTKYLGKIAFILHENN